MILAPLSGGVKLNIADNNVYEVGTDTFVVRDGKIVAQSFAARITPKP